MPLSERDSGLQYPCEVFTVSVMTESTSREAVADDLLKFLDAGVTPFHAAASVRHSLADNGFDELRLDQRWAVKPGGKYT